MATCPRCHGALTEHHKCPKGFFSRLWDAFTTVGVGAIIGAIVCLMIEDRPPTALILAAAALGGVLGSALRQAIHQ